MASGARKYEHPRIPRPPWIYGNELYIRLYNASPYSVMYADRLFGSLGTLEPGRSVYLGGGVDRMTEIKLIMTIPEPFMIKKIEFDSWAGYSWIIHEQHVKQKQFGSNRFSFSDEDLDVSPINWKGDALFETLGYPRQADQTLNTTGNRSSSLMPGAGVNTSTPPNPKDLNRSSGDPVGELVCKVCWTEKSRVMFEPCGHLSTCETCAGQLENCCMCRASITSRRKVFY